jgi:hypothetical protein
MLANLVEAHGVEAQNEHFIPTLNIWLTPKSEFGYPTILKELCGSKLTKLGGSFGVDQVFYNNLKHSATKATPFQMVTGKSPIMPMTWAMNGNP